MTNNEQIQKYLKLARRASEEGNSEDAKKYYDLLRTEDPDNAEAKFFYAYYNLWAGTKGEVFNNFLSFCNVVDPVVKLIAESGDDITEKAKIIEIIYKALAGVPASVRSIQMQLWQSAPDATKPMYNDEKKKCEKRGIEMLYGFGDVLEKYFGGETSIMKIAVEAWKNGVNLNQQCPYCGIEKGKADKYLPKIQKIDPAYTLPKKAGCISFG